MQDRVPLYPGRVKLTPVSGQSNVYDMELADSPTVAGTALNKANLLTDATAAAVQALIDNANMPDTPNEATNLLAQAIAAGAKIQTGSYVGTGTYGAANPCSLTFDFEPQIFMVLSVGESYGLIWQKVPDDTTMYSVGNKSNTYVYLYKHSDSSITLSGNTLSWYAKQQSNQVNVTGYIYKWIAVG